jgi:hypothetical protein
MLSAHATIFWLLWWRVYMGKRIIGMVNEIIGKFNQST